MSQGVEQHKAALAEWLKTAVGEGWIDGEEIAALESLESHGAERLFRTPQRPLTVALFGGTGVGKSSLLNCLVGERVAEVGVQRPTSTGVTLYVHEHYPLRDLGEFFPVERVRILTHRREDFRNVLWIDMPDIDSVETANRELVFQWLPYIDWLVYVVSPERYRDDAGWRVLQQRGHRHHWLFVMNKWDTGSEEQYSDFARILDESGFEGSRLIRTTCHGAGDDGLAEMTGIINRAVAEQGLARLQEVGERARLADLGERCERYASMLGDDAQWRGFLERAEAALQDKLEALARYLKDETAIAAAEVAGRPSGDDGPGASAVPRSRLTAQYLQDIESAVAVVREGLPAEPVRRGTRTALASLDERLHAAITDAFREGAARPGNALQRGLVALMKRLVFALPLAACAGVAWVVLSRYQQGLSGSGEFLGLDFLAHSLMVLGLAALTPWLAARLLRPSVKRSIVRRVDAALREIRAAAAEEWRAAMRDVSQRRETLRQSLGEIRAAIESGP
ncbi:MAG TPA: GTPase [Arenicellales bacterium]|nr:GTPase [Arenicellales bacterium]